MKEKKKEAERLADELLMAFGKELGQAREDYCEALMDPDCPDPPVFIDGDTEVLLQELKTRHGWNGVWAESEELEDLAGLEDLAELEDVAGLEDLAAWDVLSPMADMSRRRGSRRVLRRALILAATLILVMGLALVAAEGVKLKQSTMHMRETAGESTKITDIEKTKFNIADFRVTYVPEGYELVEDVVVNEFVRKIGYADTEEKELWIKISKTEQFGLNVDNESAGRREVLVNDNQAYLFDDGKKCIIVWQVGDCTVYLEGKLPEEELIQIASHIYVN